VLAPLLAAPPASMARPGVGDVWELLKAGHRFRGLGKRHAYDLLRWLPMPLYDFTHEWFESERLRALVAADGLSGSMLAPRAAGGTLTLFLRLAHRHLAGGPMVVRGGPGACTQAMAAAATSAGAEIRTSTKVERILTAGGRITGVVANGSEIACDVILSALDPKTTFLELVEEQALPADFHQHIRNYRAAGTLAKVNLALDALPAFASRGTAQTPPELLTGRIHIGDRLDDLERAFDQIKYGQMSEQPWLDVTIPSLLDASLAPQGAHVASIYVHHAPERLRAGEWNEARAVLLERTIAMLERCAPDVRSHIVAAQVLTPADLAEQPGMWGGHIHHGELAPDQLMGLRPTIDAGTYRMPVAGLFLCGAGTHPGGFASGASGRLAVRRVLKTVRR
jgi:phytoene dehydrogenase-like protein